MRYVVLLAILAWTTTSWAALELSPQIQGHFSIDGTFYSTSPHISGTVQSWGTAISDWTVANQREVVIASFSIPADVSWVQNPVYLTLSLGNIGGGVFLFDSQGTSGFDDSLTHLYNMVGGSDHTPLRHIDITQEFHNRMALDFVLANDQGDDWWLGMFPHSFSGGMQIIDSDHELLVTGDLIQREGGTPEPSSLAIWLILLCAVVYRVFLN